MFHLKPVHSCTPEHWGQVSLPKASLNTEISHSLSNLCILPTVLNVFIENQMKDANLSRTDENQTNQEPATDFIEELLFCPYFDLPPTCWEYAEPRKKCRITNHTKDNCISCMDFNFQPDLCVGRRHISLKTIPAYK